MKKTILFLTLSSFLLLFFSACSSKTQTDIIDSNNQDISSLLKTLIEKEKQINELNKKIANCGCKK